MSRETPVDALGIDRWPVDGRPTPDRPISVHVPESIHHMAKRLNQRDSSSARSLK